MDRSRPHLRFPFLVALALVFGLLPGASQAQQLDPRCSEPGVTILTDVIGDALTTQPFHDIDRISIAEPPTLGPGKVMFIIKMVSLATVPPQHSWPILFASPAGDFNVRMSTRPLPTPTFSVAPGTGQDPVLNPGTPADPASNFSADGTIRIVVTRAQIGNPLPGQFLSSFITRIRIHGSAGDLTPDNMPDDLVRAGEYQLIGSENCVTNRPPVAVDDTGTTVNGFPTTINVIANDSDPDGDTLTVTSVTDPPNGTAVNNGDGTVTYTPDCPLVTGNDTFNYTIDDGNGGTDTAMVTVRNRKTSRRGSIDPCAGD